MNKNTNRGIWIIAVLAAVLTMLFACGAAYAAGSGTCGDQLTWTLDEEGVLTITGTGKMTSHPWTEGRSCYEVKKVVLKEGVTHICDSAFNGCRELTEVSIPGSVTMIDSNAFNSCSALTAIAIPKGVREIGAAFMECDNLITVSLPDGLETIGSSAFWGCKKLVNITIPDSVTEIGRNAFQQCGIVNMTIPAGMAEITDQLFLGCENLETVTLPDGLTWIGNSAFWECFNLKRIIMPDSVTDLGTCIFMDCKSLEEVHISKGISFIPNDTFSGCASLTEITLPEKVDRISSNVFRNCEKLKSLTIQSEDTVFENRNSFDNCASLSVITVPATNTQAIAWFRENGFENMLNIVRVPIDRCVFGQIEDQIYTGKKITLKISITRNEQELLENEDYTVSFSNNKNIGNATVTVTGTGKYEGKKKLSFRIIPAPIQIDSVEAGSGKLILSWKKGKGITGYEIEYSLKKNFKNSKTIRITKAKTTKKEIKKLTKGKTYYLRIRAYKKKGKAIFYSDWSGTVKKKVK